MKDYQTFLASKRFHATPAGFTAKDINAKLFPFQRDIVAWACQKGKK